MEILVTLALGIGLASASGFRIFVPFTFLSMAALAGMVELSPTWDWIGTYPALITFSIATLLEITAYYIPWLDNLLDTVAVPAAIVAGSVVTASVTTELSPLLTWTLAIIVGGGAAGVVQAGTTVLRSLSSVGSLGTGNFIVATSEWVAATIFALLAILLPIFAALSALVIVILILRRLRRGRRPQHTAQPTA
ncbi:MAG: DUF4126 domain-containing protein [Litorilinea sp.]